VHLRRRLPELTEVFDQIDEWPHHSGVC
jgi:hypothetical protein